MVDPCQALTAGTLEVADEIEGMGKSSRMAEPPAKQKLHWQGGAGRGNSPCMNRAFRRRHFLKLGSTGLLCSAFSALPVVSSSRRHPKLRGVVIGEPTAVKTGARIFEEGGN